MGRTVVRPVMLTPRVVSRVTKNAEHILDKKACHGESHAGEMPHEEAHRVGKISVKRRETIHECVYPGTAVVNPTKMWMKKDAKNKEKVRQVVHIDQNNTQ